MRRVFTLLTLTVICVAMSLSTAEAQRHNNRHESERKESYRGGGNSGSRPSRSPATGLNSQRAPDVPTTQESVPAQVRADLPVRAIPVPRATVPALESTDPPALAIPAIM